MTVAAHWEKVFQTKPHEQVSWFRPHLELSLELIQRFCPKRQASIIDVGAGESTLVDDLLALDYEKLTILDVSSTAIDLTRARLGARSNRVQWMVGDITEVAFPSPSFDLWHDRAVFHFLIDPRRRRKDVRAVLDAVRPGGHVIVSTFGPNGPARCSGLDVMRYDAESLHDEFGRRFRITESTQEMHRTPWGAEQQFTYCCCKLDSGFPRSRQEYLVSR
jgi:SAM-dependent methyltransferase